ncbi:MAG: hypothetical protein GX983_09840, partial [Corynebacterium sp.]|nr:hypothetical protein [Corynebacterium sp.]
MAQLDQHTSPGSVMNYPYDDHNEQSPQEECGVFGVWAPGEEVAKLT